MKNFQNFSSNLSVFFVQVNRKIRYQIFGTWLKIFILSFKIAFFLPFGIDNDMKQIIKLIDLFFNVHQRFVSYLGPRHISDCTRFLIVPGVAKQSPYLSTFRARGRVMSVTESNKRMACGASGPHSRNSKVLRNPLWETMPLTLHTQI